MRNWVRIAVVTAAVTGAVAGTCLHAHAATRTAAAPAAATRFTAGQHRDGCRWMGRGKKDHGYLEIRMIKDTCARTRLRIRACGKPVVQSFRCGNWIDKIHQLTSLQIGPDVYTDFGYDYQWNWPKGAKHRGKVHYVSEDPGVRATAMAASSRTPTAKTPVVYALDGYDGYSHQYVRPLRFSMEQGTDQWRHAGWSWGSTSATSKHAQYRYCSSGAGGTCGPWESVKIKFTGIRYHTIRNLGGGRLRIKYFIRGKITFPDGVVQHRCFGTGSGTKVKVWYSC